MAQGGVLTATDADALLACATRDLATPEGWSSWLSLAARLPSLSLRNQLLVGAQLPSAELVMPASRWASLGRGPLPEAVPLRIWAPAGSAPSGTDAAGRSRWALVPVLDISQTSGVPLPVRFAPPAPLPAGIAPEGLWDLLRDSAADLGRPVALADRRAAGCPLRPGSRIIRIPRGTPSLTACLALAHALAHLVPTAAPHAPLSESDADAAAAIVAAARGARIPASRTTAARQSDAADPLARAGRILAAARPLIDRTASRGAEGKACAPGGSRAPSPPHPPPRPPPARPRR